MEEKTVAYNDNFYVVQSNKAILARQDALSITEFRIIRLIISQIARDDVGLFEYKIRVADLADYLGVTPQSLYYQNLKDLCNDLRTKGLYIDKGTKDRHGNPNFKTLAWAPTIDYDDGIITIKINDDLKPYLLGLRDYFTEYPVGQIKKLESAYAARLFEILYSYVWRKYKGEISESVVYGIPVANDEVVLTVDGLREMLDCQDKYAEQKDFVKRVIKPAITQISEKALFPCSYEPIRKGRSYGYIKFKLDDWNSRKVDLLEDDEP